MINMINIQKLQTQNSQREMKFSSSPAPAQLNSVTEYAYATLSRITN